VRALARGTGKLVKLQELGAEIKYCDAWIQKQLPQAVSGAQGGTVVYAVPPAAPLPPGKAITQVMQAAYGAGAECFIYISSSGLYGDRPDDDVVVDEDTPIARDDQGMKNVWADEEAILSVGMERMRTVILRLAPMYGPGRGVRARLRKGEYKLIDDGTHTISRIHVDDAVGVIFAAEEHAARRSVYLVADDLSTTQLEYATWLTERMGYPLPESRPLIQPGARPTHRNRRINNAKMKAELQYTLRYPTFREGEAAIESEEAAP
jgi:nucleoside-diphosphate-sugar epimerase